MSYTVYAVKHCPAEMLAKYPTPAVYAEKQVYLFGESLFEIAGIEPSEVFDVEALGFNYPFVGGEQGLTVEQLNDIIDMLLRTLSPAEGRLSNEQGRYLHETRFKTKIV